MRCNKAKILLSASLDGELSLRQQLVLDRHIESCSDCAHDKAEFAGLRDVMSLWPDEEPSEWMAANFSQKLEQFQCERQASRPMRSRWAFGLISAGAAAAIIMVVMHASFFRPTSTVNHNTIAIQPRIKNATPAPQATKIATNPTAPKTNTGSQTGIVPTLKNAGLNHQHRQVLLADNGISRNNHVRGSLVPSSDINKKSLQESAKKVNPDQVNEVRVAMALASDDTAISEVAKNLGEADLAMNESVERVRGTLQEAADLVDTASSSPGGDGTDHNGGSTP